MIEQFTNAELEQILKEIEERKQLAKSRTKSTVCGNELAKIKSRLASMTESKVSGGNAIRSAILCAGYLNVVLGVHYGKVVYMVYEYRIDVEDFGRTLTDPVARQKMLDAIGEFARIHDVDFDLLIEEYEEIADMLEGKDAVLFTIEETGGMYKRRLSIYTVKGAVYEIYCAYNEYAEILPLSRGGILN